MVGQTVWITGSSGFVGSNLALRLRTAGWNVLGLDLEEPQYAAPEEFIQGDVRDGKLLEDVLRTRRVDAILHLAARATVQEGRDDPSQTWDVNVGGTLCLLEALKNAGQTPALIYASTDKVYGPLKSGEKYDEQLPLRPLRNSPYDCSKATADQLVRDWAQYAGVHAVVLRFCNLYGPYDTHESRIVPAGIRAMLAGRPGVLHKYLDQSGQPRDFYRDMLYVDDLCAGVEALTRWLLEAPPPVWGGAFNLGAPSRNSMSRVMEEIRSAVGFEAVPVVQYVKTEHVITEQSMNSEKARRSFGFCPTTSLHDGIVKTVQWWRDEGEHSRT